MSNEDFLDDGWCWMTHPSYNCGNAIPVYMAEINGTRFYHPLDPSDATEFEWDRRDDEWKIVQSWREQMRDPFREMLADQAEVIDLAQLKKALARMGVAAPSGGMEHLAANLASMVNALARAVETMALHPT